MKLGLWPPLSSISCRPQLFFLVVVAVVVIAVVEVVTVVVVVVVGAKHFLLIVEVRFIYPVSRRPNANKKK